MKNFIEILKKLINYSIKIFLFLLSIVIVISIIFLAIRYFQLSSYEAEKTFEDETLYFDVKLSTSYRTKDLEEIIEGDGRVYYKLYLKGYLEKYKYDKYDRDDRITISFLDKSGFKLYEEDFLFKDFTRIVDEGKVVGFNRLDTFYEDFSDYKKTSFIRVTWTCNFQSK